jgi:hypothetical protein
VRIAYSRRAYFRLTNRNDPVSRANISGLKGRQVDCPNADDDQALQLARVELPSPSQRARPGEHMRRLD